MVLRFMRRYMAPDDGGEGAGGAGGESGDAGVGKGSDGDSGGSSGLLADALKGKGENKGDGGKAAGDGASENNGSGDPPKPDGEGSGDSDGKPARPDFLPEQFWDAEKGEPLLESMTKAWKDARSALKNKGGESPKTPDEYKFEAPEGLDVSDKDPGVQFFRQAAHKAGISNEAFNTAVGEFLTLANEAGFLVKPIDTKEELKKLGPSGDAKMHAIAAWTQNLKDSGVWDERDIGEVALLGATAEGITALNKLREFYGGERIPVESQGVDQADIQTFYNRMGEKDANGNLRMATDPQFRKETEEMGKRLFGTEPKRTGIRGLPR